jgi:hypothetical protein
MTKKPAPKHRRRSYTPRNLLAVAVTSIALSAGAVVHAAPIKLGLPVTRPDKPIKLGLPVTRPDKPIKLGLPLLKK